MGYPLPLPVEILWTSMLVALAVLVITAVLPAILSLAAAIRVTRPRDDGKRPGGILRPREAGRRRRWR